MPTTIAVLSLKGGVGKTVTSAHLASAFAQQRPTLLCDLDPQGSASNYFQADQNQRDDETASAIDSVLLNATPLQNALLEVRPNLQMAPAGFALSEAEARLPHLPGGDLKLQRALRQYHELSSAETKKEKKREASAVALIDCPSSWGALVRNAILASTHLIIPINSESAALETAIATENLVRELCENYERPLPQIGVLLTCFRSTRLARGVAGAVAGRWPDCAFSTVVRRVERINELTAQRATIFDVSQSAGGTARTDYEALAQEIERTWLQKTKKSKK